MRSYCTLTLQEKSSGLLTVTLKRPEVRNAFNQDMIAELQRVFTEEATSSQVKMVWLQGSGECFCAGGDLNWMKRSVDLSLEENREDTLKLTRMFRTLNEFPKPLLGTIQGAAIGGGVGLVSVLDIAVASAETQFSLSEVRLGLIPACIGPFVIAKIGPSHARQLFLSAERFTAQRAWEVGLVHKVVSNAQELQSEGQRISDQILSCGPGALIKAKELIHHLSWPESRSQLNDPFDYASEMLAELRITPEAQEGVRAFLEKRRPKWLS